MSIKDAIDKSVPQERINKIGYHNLDILSRMMNYQDGSTFSVYTSYTKNNKIGSNLFNFKKIKDDMYYDNQDNKNQKIYEKPFNFDTQDFLDKNNKIVYVTYNNQEFFGKLEDISTIY
jgi:hypothetical protein